MTQVSRAELYLSDSPPTTGQRASAARWAAASVAASVVAGALVGTGGYIGIGIVVALAAATLVLCSPRARARAAQRDTLILVALASYLCPLFMLGRVFALVGHNPVYAPDVLLLGAAALMLPLSRGALRKLAPLPLFCVLVALLALHAVYVGVHHGYPTALKGIVLAFYPLVAVVIAAWFGSTGQAERLLSFLPRYVLPLVPLGLAMVVVTGGSEIPASYGLYLGIAAAFAASPRVPRRRLLALTTVLGAGLLVAISAKRGAAITVLLAPAAAWLAASRYRSRLRSVLTVCSGLAAVTLVALVVSLGVISLTHLPVAGAVVARATGQSVSATDNVGLREAMWSYALHTTYSQNPLLGVGAYHPIEVTYAGNDISLAVASGVHNSFVGYAFYAGLPAGLLVAMTFLIALWRTWRIRWLSDYAPAMFGSLVAVVLTALTNVAFETTYIGGPSWVILACAAGLAASHRTSEA
jgi:O-antigen ligase